VIVVPSLELVVVRLGHLRSMRGVAEGEKTAADICLSNALGLLREAIPTG
jgi:hypothetical protein